MGIVHIDKVKQDMVLSDDVKDINGRFLLKKGQVIQSNHVKILKKWGVTEVNIVGNAGTEESAETYVDPELIEKIKENTKPVFKYTDLSHPAVKEIFRLAVLHRSQNNNLGTEQNVISPDSGYDDSEDNMIKDVRKTIFENEIKLPEIPSIVFELNEVIADTFSTAVSIAQTVNKSPSLTALLLKIVNSSFYGFPSKIDSISRAVMMIGTREISSLALGISVIKIFKGIPKDIFEMDSFLKHSFACGIISRMLAAHKNLAQTEQLFVSVLLHDIGRLIIYKYFPAQARSLLYRAKNSGNLLYEEESSLLGSKHTIIGKYLLKKWKLPFSLENNIFYHHNPSNAQDPVQAGIVHLADIIVNSLGIGSSGEKFVPPLDNEAWDRLDLMPSSFEMVIRQATHQLSSFESFLQG